MRMTTRCLRLRWVALGAFVMTTACGLLSGQEIVEYAQTFKANNSYEIAWCTQDTAVRFRLTGKATGWLGIGFNNVQNMVDADVVMATGEGAIQDAFADFHGAPSKDESQDVTLLSSGQANGTTTIEFLRPVTTADVDRDYSLDGDRYLVWAYNSNQDGFNRQHSVRGFSSAKFNFGSTAACKITVPFDNDFTGDKVVDVSDINALLVEVRAKTNGVKFDVNTDAVVDQSDIAAYLVSAFNSYVGDSTLDGVFGSADFVQIFTEGTYEDDIPFNSQWQQGDWNGDGDFSSGDLVFAFSEGGYEAGPRAAIASVPEPSTWSAVFVAGCSLAAVARRRRAIEHV